jgi:antibiotic biosynthesis monooxygenase (ABM) superfamily enzyme
MAVQVLIRRKIMETKAKKVSPLIVKLRSLATIQPGYICGETLNCIDPPGRSEYLVRSTWHTVEDWKKWLHSKERSNIIEGAIRKCSSGSEPVEPVLA